MVVPAFGFSVGDFVAATALIAKAARSLNEASGAAAQYQQAAADLNLLLALLRRVQSLDTENVSSHIIEKVQLCSHACHIPLAHFLRKLEKFDLLSHTTSRPDSVNVLVRNSRKVKWALLIEPELAKLKTSLAPQLATIEILLQLSSAEEVAKTHKITTKTREDLQSLLARANDVKDHLDHTTSSRTQIADLQTLMEGFHISQLHDKRTMLSAANITVDRTESILTKVTLQEIALNALLRKADDHLSPSTRNTTPNLRPLHQRRESTPQDLREERSETLHQPNDVTTAERQTEHFLLAVRSVVAEVLVMLFSLIPTVRRFFAFLMAIPVSPTLLLESNINLEDALGRTLSLPFEHFRYWPVLEARLQEAFVGLPGEEKVVRMEYHIIDPRRGGNSVLTKSVWSKAIRPGCSLSMSMLYYRNGHAKRTCPRCLHVTTSTDAWIRCIACGLTYRMLDSRPKTHPKPTTSSHDIGHLSGYEDIMELVNFIDPETLKAYDEITTAQRDMLHFKRVHLVGSLRAKSGPGFVNSGADKGLQRPQNDHLTETPQRGTAIPPDRATQYSSIGRPSLHIPPADQKPSRDGPVDESRSERKRKQVKLDLNDSEPDLLKPRRDTRENLVREHSKGRVKLANDLNPVREEVLPHKDATKEDIPPGARWTKIDRRLVNPGSLEEANEQFEERRDCVIVLRVLTKEEIQRYADRTNILREAYEAEDRRAEAASRLTPDGHSNSD